MHILVNFLVAAEVLLSLILIALITSQTSKSEGLGGSIGGATSSNFRFKPGFEERLDSITRNFAVAWMVTCLLIAIFAHR